MKYDLKPWLTTAFLLLMQLCIAQTDSTEEEDFEQYANMKVKDGSTAKVYCTSKILAQTPSRLISIGFDVFGPFDLTTNSNQVSPDAYQASNSRGLRLEANFPIISNQKLIWSLGGSYTDQYYSWKEPQPSRQQLSPLFRTLRNGSLRNLSLVSTLFKPLDEKHFVLAQAQGDYAGDWNFTNWQSPRFIKLSATAIYGFKPNDRKMLGLGITRTYRAGEVNYLPVLLYNYTAPSEKWGLEMLLPARADYRYNISKRNIIRTGFELEGTSYRLNDRERFFASHPQFAGRPTDRLELRRSDIRIRAMWDFPMKNFYWLSIAAGYRLVYNFNLDNREFYRGFGNKAYLAENKMGGAPFISIIATMVSP